MKTSLNSLYIKYGSMGDELYLRSFIKYVWEAKQSLGTASTSSRNGGNKRERGEDFERNMKEWLKALMHE